MEKPRIILYPTIPHSGTRFLSDHILKEVGYTRRNVLDNPEVYKVGLTIVHSHFLPQTRYINICNYADEYKCPILMPLRTPESVIKSWKKRNKSMDECYQQHLLAFLFIKKYKPILLPLEEPNKRLWFHELKKKLNLPELKTDWYKRFSAGDKEVEFTKKDEYMLKVLNKIYKEVLYERKS